MVIGPNFIIACPHCKGLAAKPMVESGNNLDRTLWSDGLEVWPNYPDPVEFVKCSHCGGFFWQEDAVVVGVIDSPAKFDRCQLS